MTEALNPVVEKHITDPYKRLQRRVQPGGNFGDAQLKPSKATPKVILRFFLAIPIGAVGVALCVSVVGLPLGIPIMLWVGAFISKPIRKHPTFNTETVREED
jgi:hypothetical protein